MMELRMTQMMMTLVFGTRFMQHSTFLTASLLGGVTNVKSIQAACSRADVLLRNFWCHQLHVQAMTVDS